MSGWMLPAIMIIGAVAVIAFLVWLVLAYGMKRGTAARPWLATAGAAGVVCGVLGALLAFLPA